MAMFEEIGYCPNNAFGMYSKEKNPNWGRTMEVLGDRRGYMVYTPGGCWKEESYIVDCILGGKETLGIEIATVLSVLIPECRYPRVGKKILLTDLVNDLAIPQKCKILEDSRYVVGILDDEGAVIMFIYKK